MNQAERNGIVPKCNCCKCYSSNVEKIMLKLDDLSETADNLLRFVNERADAEEASLNQAEAIQQAPLEPTGPVESDAVTAAANLTQVFRQEQQKTRNLMTTYFVVFLALFIMVFLMLFLLLSRQGRVPVPDTLSPPSAYDTILCCARMFT
jgi:predicted nucleic acid-binding Zn ribbon protein